MQTYFFLQESVLFVCHGLICTVFTHIREHSRCEDETLVVRANFWFMCTAVLQRIHERTEIIWNASMGLSCPWPMKRVPCVLHARKLTLLGLISFQSWFGYQRRERKRRAVRLWKLISSRSVFPKLPTTLVFEQICSELRIRGKLPINSVFNDGCLSLARPWQHLVYCTTSCHGVTYSVLYVMVSWDHFTPVCKESRR